MKVCPHCARQIPDVDAAGAVCIYCGRNVYTPTLGPSQTVVPQESLPRPDPASGQAAPQAAPGAGPNTGRLAAIALAGLVAGASALMLLPKLPAARSSRPASSAPSAAPNGSPAARASAPSPPSTEPAPTKWRGANRAGWAVDGSRIVAFELAAEHDVPVWMKRVRPVLVVRCLARDTEVFVLTASAASIEPSGTHTVHIAFDERADVVEQWSASADHQALFAPDGLALAREIAGARTMRVGFTPYNASAVTTDFDVRGFDDLVGSVAKACRWKP